MKRELDAALAELDDYVRGAKSDADAEAYEDALFARAVSGEAPELGFRAGLGRTLRVMGERGTLDLWLTGRDLSRVLQSGLRVRQIEIDLTQPAPPDLSGEFDLLITKVPLSLEGVQRLDAEVVAPSGALLKSMPDIPFDAADAGVYACCEVELARTALGARTVTRFWATYDDGRRLLGEIVML